MTKYLSLNDCVWAELTELGWKRIRQYYDRVFSISPKHDSKMIQDAVQIHMDNTNELFVDGEVRKLTLFQLHQLMNIFGDVVTPGGDDFIVNNKIYLTLE